MPALPRCWKCAAASAGKAMPAAIWFSPAGLLAACRSATRALPMTVMKPSPRVAQPRETLPVLIKKKGSHNGSRYSRCELSSSGFGGPALAGFPLDGSSAACADLYLLGLGFRPLGHGDA